MVEQLQALVSWRQIQFVIIALSILLLLMLLQLYRLSAQKKQCHHQLFELQKQIELQRFNHERTEHQLEQAKQQTDTIRHGFLTERAELIAKLDELQQQLSLNQLNIGELSQRAERNKELTQEVQELRYRLEQEVAKNAGLTEQLSALKSSINKEREHMSEKLAALEKSEKRLATEFENIANRIFQQKSESFSKSSETGLNQILSPLKIQLEEFKKQVNDHYVNEGKERASLKTEITSLKVLNQKITEEAAALTSALKGDNKKQGNWGEIVLERLLEESGLRKGHEYAIQVGSTNDQGKRMYPDVVVHLPNKKDVIIDSKVSLSAYERLTSASDESERELALKQHLTSVRTHIKGLSKKDYQDLEGIRTLDYVLMFIPIEAAFITAIEHDPELIKLALNNQIMIVSPTNLLVALRTIHNIWQYEYQHENATKIAEQAKKIYDKFVGFLQDMEKVGKQIDTASAAYEAAMNKLQSGRGNIIRQLENFRQLGVNTNKTIDNKYLDDSEE